MLFSSITSRATNVIKLIVIAKARFVKIVLSDLFTISSKIVKPAAHDIMKRFERDRSQKMKINNKLKHAKYQASAFIIFLKCFSQMKLALKLYRSNPQK